MRSARATLFGGSAVPALLRLGDAVAAIGAMTGALFVWSAMDSIPFTGTYVTAHAAWFLLVAPWMLLLAPASRPAVMWSLWDTAVVSAHAAVAGGALYLLVFFLAPREMLPRLVVLCFLVIAFVTTTTWRIVFVQVCARAWPRNRIAIVGAGPAARAIADVLQTRTPHNQVLAFISDRGPAGETTRPPVMGVDGLERLVAEGGVSELILAPDEPLTPALIHAVLHARERRVGVVQMQTVYEHLLHRVPIRHLAPDAALVLSGGPEDALSSLGKRAVDAAAGVAGCAATLLLLPVLGPAIWLDVGRPIFFTQQRVGRAGRPFRLVKFRTMQSDAERDGPRWAGNGDSRASRFGRFLRRFCLDELPQSWNVLKGDMSLVGPRPERPEFTGELEHAVPYYAERWTVRPGLTGWAQINYPYGRSVEDVAVKLEYDLYYVKHRGLIFDLLIALHTAWAIVALGDR